MRNILFAALFCWAATGGAGVYGQQVQLLEAASPGQAATAVSTAAAHTKPAAKKSAAKTSAAAAKPVEVKEFAAKFEMQLATAPAKTAAKSAKAAKPASAAAPKPAMPAAAAAAKAATPKAKPPVAAPKATAMGMELPEPMTTAAAPSAAAPKPAAPAAGAAAKAAAPKAKPAAAAPKVTAMGMELPEPMTPAASPKATAMGMELPEPMTPAASPKATAMGMELPEPMTPAAAPSATASKPAAAAGEGFSVEKRHKISDGETLWDLSGKYYNDPFKWGKIYNANLNTVQNPNLIYPRAELVIPDITEQVAPARKAPAEIPGADTFQEGEFTASDVSQAAAPAVPEASAAGTRQPAAKAAGTAGVAGPGFFDSEGLSSEMPEDQKGWPISVKVVPGNWMEDGVIAAKPKSGSGGAMEDGLSFSGETVFIQLTRSLQVKKGDSFNVYLRGTTALDKRGRRIGRELQLLGLLRVISLEGRAVKCSLESATGPVSKGMVVKLSARP